MILLKEGRITILLFRERKRERENCSLLTLNIARALLNENLLHSFKNYPNIWNTHDDIILILNFLFY